MQASVKEEAEKESRSLITSSLLNDIKKLGLYDEGKIEPLKGIGTDTHSHQCLLLIILVISLWTLPVCQAVNSFLALISKNSHRDLISTSNIPIFKIKKLKHGNGLNFSEIVNYEEADLEIMFFWPRCPCLCIL